MKYTVNGVDMQYDAEGPRAYGNERTLLNEGVDLTQDQPWGAVGYTVAPLFSQQEQYATLVQNAKSTLKKILKSEGLAQGETDLTKYHQLIGDDYPVHLRVVNRAKLLPIENFPVPIDTIEEVVSNICGVALEARNPWDGEAVYHFRVVRPHAVDNNPLHRDVWLPDYDNCINLYIPIVGSNALSSLILAPGSHHWPESKVEKTLVGALVKDVQFNVPAVTGISGEYYFKRPSPKENEILVFSPYLVHGGAINLNVDTTRISIELRLWAKHG